MFVWILDRFWIEWLDSEYRKTLIGEPLCIFDRRLGVNSWDFISENMLRPLDLLIHRDFKHVEQKFFIINIWKFSSDFFQDIREKCHMRQFITTNIGDHTPCRRHLHMIHECIEECESVIEVEAFEKEIRDNPTEEVRVRRFIDKILINFSDICVSLQKNRITPPEIVNIFSLFCAHDCLEDRRITLRMNRFLICLDREEKIYLWTRDIIREIRKINCLDRVEKDQK